MHTQDRLVDGHVEGAHLRGKEKKDKELWPKICALSNADQADVMSTGKLGTTGGLVCEGPVLDVMTAQE